MSDIYRAFDLVNRRDVAIKIPDQSIIGDPAQYERFQRELEVINTLNHPAILKGLGSGKYNRIPYLVTEFVDGRSLRTIIDEDAPMPPEQAILLVRKIAEGMAYCHANNVIHRDLKPENILVTKEGQPVIMDFGLASYERLAQGDLFEPERHHGHARLHGSRTNRGPTRRSANGCLCSRYHTI